MREMLERERITELVKWETTMIAIGTFLGISGKDLFPRIKTLKETLRPYIDHYAFRTVSVLKALKQRLNAMQADRVLLAKTEALATK